MLPTIFWTNFDLQSEKSAVNMFYNLIRYYNKLSEYMLEWFK